MKNTSYPDIMMMKYKWNIPCLVLNHYTNAQGTHYIDDTLYTHQWIHFQVRKDK